MTDYTKKSPEQAAWAIAAQFLQMGFPISVSYSKDTVYIGGNKALFWENPIPTPAIFPSGRPPTINPTPQPVTTVTPPLPAPPTPLPEDAYVSSYYDNAAECNVINLDYWKAKTGVSTITTLPYDPEVSYGLGITNPWNGQEYIRETLPWHVTKLYTPLTREFLWDGVFQYTAYKRFYLNADQSSYYLGIVDSSNNYTNTRSPQAVYPMGLFTFPYDRTNSASNSGVVVTAYPRDVYLLGNIMPMSKWQNESYAQYNAAAIRATPLSKSKMWDSLTQKSTPVVEKRDFAYNTYNIYHGFTSFFVEFSSYSTMAAYQAKAANIDISSYMYLPTTSPNSLIPQTQWGNLSGNLVAVSDSWGLTGLYVVPAITTGDLGFNGASNSRNARSSYALDHKDAVGVLTVENGLLKTNFKASPAFDTPYPDMPSLYTTTILYNPKLPSGRTNPYRSSPNFGWNTYSGFFHAGKGEQQNVYACSSNGIDYAVYDKALNKISFYDVTVSANLTGFFAGTSFASMGDDHSLPNQPLQVRTHALTLTLTGFAVTHLYGRMLFSGDGNTCVLWANQASIGGNYFSIVIYKKISDVWTRTHSTYSSTGQSNDFTFCSVNYDGTVVTGVNRFSTNLQIYRFSAEGVLTVSVNYNLFSGYPTGNTVNDIVLAYGLISPDGTTYWCIFKNMFYKFDISNTPTIVASISPITIGIKDTVDDTYWVSIYYDLFRFFNVLPDNRLFLFGDNVDYLQDPTRPNGYYMYVSTGDCFVVKTDGVTSTKVTLPNSGGAISFGMSGDSQYYTYGGYHDCAYYVHSTSDNAFLGRYHDSYASQWITKSGFFNPTNVPYLTNTKEIMVHYFFYGMVAKLTGMKTSVQVEAAKASIVALQNSGVTALKVLQNEVEKLSLNGITDEIIKDRLGYTPTHPTLFVGITSSITTIPTTYAEAKALFQDYPYEQDRTIPDMYFYQGSGNPLGWSLATASDVQKSKGFPRTFNVQSGKDLGFHVGVFCEVREDYPTFYDVSRLVLRVFKPNSSTAYKSFEGGLLSGFAGSNLWTQQYKIFKFSLSVKDVAELSAVGATVFELGFYDPLASDLSLPASAANFQNTLIKSLVNEKWVAFFRVSEVRKAILPRVYPTVIPLAAQLKSFNLIAPDNTITPLTSTLSMSGVSAGQTITRNIRYLLSGFIGTVPNITGVRLTRTNPMGNVLGAVANDFTIVTKGDCLKVIGGVATTDTYTNTTTATTPTALLLNTGSTGVGVSVDDLLGFDLAVTFKPTTKLATVSANVRTLSIQIMSGTTVVSQLNVVGTVI